MNNTYIVKKGDTLYGISNQFGVSVLELAIINNKTADTLNVGDILIIPSKSGDNPDNMFLYTVKKGDSLYSIALVYHTTVDKIKEINYLDGNQLYIGQVLRIPEKYYKTDEINLPEYINYIVSKGDTLYSIAKKFNIGTDIIMQDNSLVNTNLEIGKNLKIRVNDEQVVECFGDNSYPSLDNNIKYRVVKGDNLYSIAKKYNITVEKLKTINNLYNNNIFIGQELIIPSNNIIYIVKAGDSLYSIAKEYGVLVDEIKAKNSLNSNKLSIGQKLYI